MHMYIIFRLYGGIVHIEYSQMITLSIVFVTATIKHNIHFAVWESTILINILAILLMLPRCDRHKHIFA